MSICLNIRLCTTCMPGAHRNRRGSQIPLDLELRMVVNHRMGARNRTQVICKSKNTQWLSPLASLGMAYSNQAEPRVASLAFLFAHYRGYRKCLFRDHNSWLSQRDWGVIWVWLGLF